MKTTTPACLRRLLLSAGLVLASIVLLPTSSQAQTWLVSTDPFVRIGVLDKFGQLGAYTATFVVTESSTGKEYTLLKNVEKGQNGVDVIFPTPAVEADYFKTPAGIAAKGLPGAYVWQCSVNGKKVAGGRFDIPNVSNDVTVVEKRK